MTAADNALKFSNASLQVFLYLQVLDVATTLLGFRIGLSEASPFIRFLVQAGPATGLVLSTMIALGLTAFCVWSGRSRVVHWINYWYAGLVLWNMLLILSL